MNNFLLKLLGVDLEEIREYNKLMKKKLETEEFFEAEKKIRLNLITYKSKDVLYLLRMFTDGGFPVKKYKDLSDKLGLHNESVYTNLKREFEESHHE